MAKKKRVARAPKARIIPLQNVILSKIHQHPVYLMLFSSDVIASYFGISQSMSILLHIMPLWLFALELNKLQNTHTHTPVRKQK